MDLGEETFPLNIEATSINTDTIPVPTLKLPAILPSIKNKLKKQLEEIAQESLEDLPSPKND